MRRIFSFLTACIVLSLLAPAAGAAPATGQSRRDVYDWDNQTLPEGCGNPFMDVHQFMMFYNASISAMVAKRGQTAKHVAELFAVSEMSNEIATLFPNFAEESPIDRLVITQLCNFQKIRAKQIKPGDLKKAAILSSDVDLHSHLVDVAPHLYRDSRKLILSSLADRSAETKRAQYMASKRDEILKAREAGRQKLRDLFD